MQSNFLLADRIVESRCCLLGNATMWMWML
jgi:hypothetical protein